MVKKILDGYNDDINLSKIIGLGGDGIVLKEVMQIGNEQRPYAVKYSRYIWHFWRIFLFPIRGKDCISISELRS